MNGLHSDLLIFLEIILGLIVAGALLAFTKILSDTLFDIGEKALRLWAKAQKLQIEIEKEKFD